MSFSEDGYMMTERKKQYIRTENFFMQVYKHKPGTIQIYRKLFQIVFAILCIWIGIEFHFFVRYFETNGQSVFISRPPGVDGFLPISSLMNLFYFVQTGEIHPVHPAGLFIFLSIIVMSFAFGKSFCSWLCPVGFLSEFIGDQGKKLFKRNLRLPKWLDYILRSIKYLLLAFFAFAIFSMSIIELKAFLSSDYNVVADIRMYDFFAQITMFSLGVILLLIVLSFFIRGFWCRFLCPYGALLGIFGILSPLKIKRNQDSCINCARCSKICPANIKVDKVKVVISDECTSCYQCIDVCPVQNTLEMKTVTGNRALPKKATAIIIIVIFLGFTGVGMLLGKWQNTVSKEKYKELYPIRMGLQHVQ